MIQVPLVQSILSELLSVLLPSLDILITADSGDIPNSLMIVGYRGPKSRQTRFLQLWMATETAHNHGFREALSLIYKGSVVVLLFVGSLSDTHSI